MLCGKAQQLSTRRLKDSSLGVPGIGNIREPCRSCTGIWANARGKDMFDWLTVSTDTALIVSGQQSVYDQTRFPKNQRCEKHQDKFKERINSTKSSICQRISLVSTCNILHHG